MRWVSTITVVLYESSEEASVTLMNREYRTIHTRAVPNEEGPRQDGLPRQFWARVVNYGVEDDYGTKFEEGFADEYLARRMPRLMFGHSGWEHLQGVLGKGIQARSVKGEGLDVLFEFDDFTYVPMARQAAYQLTSGTLDEFSVGFVRQRERRDTDGTVWITKARLGEASIVVEGSVPGTKLLSFRSPATASDEPRMLVDANDAVRIISQYSLGELDIAEALNALKAVSFDGEEPAVPDKEPPTPRADEAGAEADGVESQDPPPDTPPSEGEGEGDSVPDAETPSPDPTHEVGELGPEIEVPEVPEIPEIPEDEALSLLAELDDALELVSERDIEGVLETRVTATFQGNQHTTSKTDITDAKGKVNAARLPDTDEDDHAKWGSKAAGTLVAMGKGDKAVTVKTGRSKMWQDGAWASCLSFEASDGDSTSSHSTLAAAKTKLQSGSKREIDWVDR